MKIHKKFKRLIRPIKRLVYISYNLPEFNYDPNLTFKKFISEFKFRKLFSTLYNICIGLLTRFDIISGDISFKKYSIPIIKHKTLINPKENTVVFCFQSRYPLLALGNFVVVNQFLRLWVKKNPNHYIVFCTDYPPKMKPLIFDILKMNPDIHEIWYFQFPFKVRILNRLPNVIKVFDLFSTWHETEIAIQQGITIPELRVPQEALKKARDYLNKHIKHKNQFIFSLHIREDPRNISESNLRNPNFTTYLEFIKRIIEKYDCYIIRLGTPDLTPIKYHHLIDTISDSLSYSTQCALISLSNIFIGCHSGPQITAAALNIPTFCGSYIEDRLIEQKKMNIKSTRTPKIAENKREILFKKCYDLNGNQVPPAFDIPENYNWVDNSLDELISRFNIFFKRIKLGDVQ